MLRRSSRRATASAAIAGGCWLLGLIGWGGQTCGAETAPEPLAADATSPPKVVTYPAPDGEILSPDYEVSVAGEEVAVYTARVLDPPFAGKRWDHGGPYAFASFDLSGRAEVRITSVRSFRDVVIRPRSSGVRPVVEDEHTLRLILDSPRKLSVEPDGRRGPLLLFANPLEKDPPAPEDPGVVYFGRGVHRPEKIELGSDQTLYLAGGAVVKAEVLAVGERIRIRGRGILDGSEWAWRSGPIGNLIAIRDSTDVEVSGIALRGSSHWTIVPLRSRRVTIRNVKICNSRVQNDDGINPCNSQDVLITDCFIRSDDDCVALKGLDFSAADSNVERIVVENSILWCDRARIFLLGHESRAGFMRDVKLRNLDIVHFSMTPFLFEPGEEMRLENIEVENVRVHGEGQRELVRLRPVVNQYMRKKVPGRIRDVRFRNLSVDGRPGEYLVQIEGPDADHDVRDVTFENVSVGNVTLARDSASVRIGDHVTNVRFRGGATAAAAAAPGGHANLYADRFVWIFGWNLGRDGDVDAVAKVLDTAAGHGLSGAVVSFGLDTLCRKSPDYFRRLEEIRRVADRDKLELIPSIFSVGYGGGALAHDPNLAEGVPVVDAAFVVKDGEARLLPDASAGIENGGFEELSGNGLKGFDFYDQPGEVSFVDTVVRHGGRASLRLENFTANPHGHGRVMQNVRVRPGRCYRVGLWVKTEGLTPASSFKLQVLVKGRALAPREFRLRATEDWQKLTTLFNSLEFDAVRLYAGVWGGEGGRLWLDDWTLEEVGPLNVLRRPGTPVTVRSEDGATTYVEGLDYAPLEDPLFRPSRVDRDAPPLRLLPGSRIRDAQRLRVSWYHPMVVNSSQVTVCMAEPKLYEIFDHEAALLAERLHPRRVILSMDEVRMGGTCAACRGRDMGKVLGECVTRQTRSLRRYLPDLEVYVWSDMLDPHHNAHGDYYLVRGTFTGSWNHVPRDLVIAVWGGAPREKSLRFFAGEGFRTLIACYYDAPNLDEVKGWLRLARETPNVRGFMYTPWRKSYDLLPDFGDLLGAER